MLSTSAGARVSPAATYGRGCRTALKARAPQRARIVARAEGAQPVTEETWEAEVLQSPVPVLVDFWAPWCGPCRMIAPLMDEIAVEYGDKIKAVKVNTDESPKIATEYAIRSIPTVMIFKGGKKMDTVIGAVPKATLSQTVDKYLD
ncbi:unnamed protein product [Pedinophyceae sp. YPF-701]|nr:unnamed protein product [Pedinophyceae sp. YPF-701]